MRVGNSSQGYSVALSRDGNTVMVGGPQDDGGNGAAWVFTRSDTTWTQQGPKLRVAEGYAAIPASRSRYRLTATPR